MTAPRMSLLARLWLSWQSAFRILFDEAFAAQVAGLRAEVAKTEPSRLLEPEPAKPAGTDASTGALQLLSLLQREGRFVDFVQQEVTSFSDQDIGAAARLVHEGCRRALHSHARVVHVRHEAEGDKLTLAQASADVKLVGHVAGAAPFRGVLRHRGWRVEELTLPTLLGQHDPQVVAPAELELP